MSYLLFRCAGGEQTHEIKDMSEACEGEETTNLPGELDSGEEGPETQMDVDLGKDLKFGCGDGKIKLVKVVFYNSFFDTKCYLDNPRLFLPVNLK